MISAVNDLQSLVNRTKGYEMTTPPTDLVEISQSVIDGWANAIESAVAGLKAILDRGNIPAAEVAAMTQAVTDLESVGTVVPTTPPVTGS